MVRSAGQPGSDDDAAEGGRRARGDEPPPSPGSGDPPAPASAVTSAPRGAGPPAPGAAPGGFTPLDLGALLLASIAIGVAVSAIMTDVGTSPWVVMAAAALAYSGTGELAYASVISSGGTMVPALAAALL